MPVIVRTVDDANLDKLQQAGASEVVPEAIEGSLMLASHALALVGVPMRRVIRLVREQREARYQLLRDYFHGADDDTPAELDQERLKSFTLPPGAAACGRAVDAMALGSREVQFVAVRRANGTVSADATDQTVLAAGDTLVLRGLPKALALTEDLLLRGR